ncbi:MAG: lipase maturation factor family protein [Bdellovibrionia bacterium]
MKDLKKPLLIYDGDCGFCERWIGLWKRFTGGTVDYAPSQRVGLDFQEISEAEFESSVFLVLPSGQIFRGAQAVFRCLAESQENRGISKLWMLYERFSFFRKLSEVAYAQVARNRYFFSKLTSFFWGEGSLVSSYQVSRWVFLRALGALYCVVFLSLGSQLFGLMGSTGILPAPLSDGHLKLLWALGFGFSLAVILDWIPVLALLGAWIVHGCFIRWGGEFFAFQWDALMVEMGFLAIFIAPLQIRPEVSWLSSSLKGSGNPDQDQRTRKTTPSFGVILLLRWLLFRVVFFSGWVKWTSGDPTWRSGTALSYHFETQPLPTPLAWYLHQLPSWVYPILTWTVLAVELGVPWMIFLPRRVRHWGCFLLVFLQVCINLTGNYGFFGWQVATLSLLLIEDGIWKKIPGMNEVSRRLSWGVQVPESLLKRRLNWALVGVVFLITALGWDLGGSGRFFREVFHRYGVFAVMTTQRDEIVVEGSWDGETWLAYDFQHKPGELSRGLSFLPLHMPRLDWQMWFLPFGDWQSSGWFSSFLVRLLQGQPSVTHLLAHNPFEGQNPKYVRALRYRYQFQTEQGGGNWKRQWVGAFTPVVSLQR